MCSFSFSVIIFKNKSFFSFLIFLKQINRKEWSLKTFCLRMCFIIYLQVPALSISWKRRDLHLGFLRGNRHNRTFKKLKYYAVFFIIVKITNSHLTSSCFFPIIIVYHHLDVAIFFIFFCIMVIWIKIYLAYFGWQWYKIP